MALLRDIVAAKVTQAMKEAGFNARKLREKLHVSRSHAYRYLKGKNLTFEALEEIATLCSKPVEWFLTEGGTPLYKLDDFAGGTPSDPASEMYLDPKRAKLICEIQKLASDPNTTALVIDALLKTVQALAEKYSGTLKEPSNDS